MFLFEREERESRESRGGLLEDVGGLAEFGVDEGFGLGVAVGAGLESEAAPGQEEGGSWEG
jgi:hypothetical protein